MGFGSKIQAEGPELRLFLDVTKVTVKMLGETYEEEHVGPHLSGYLIEPFPDFFNSLEMTKAGVERPGEKHGEEDDGLHLSGYLIEPLQSLQWRLMVEIAL